jgi:polysulfide reductase chain C
MANEHFVVPPEWTWLILLYFFLAGLSGGAFVIGTLLRLFGSVADRAASRIAFLISFPLLVICPILLTIDLGKPLDFWHMVVNAGPAGGVSFKAWSPMSLGVWGLLIFGVFSFVMFLVALGEGEYVGWRAIRRIGTIATSPILAIFMVVGAIFGIFVAAYTGVLLAVSNQPIWSDTWALGGLFLASGLSGAAATVMLLTHRRRELAVTQPKLMEADRYFIILELLLIAIFLITLGGLITRTLGGPWIILWLVVLIGTVVPLLVEWRPAWGRQLSPLVAPILVLVGVLALRAVIIFSAQV